MKRIRMAIMLTVWGSAIAACGSTSDTTSSGGSGAASTSGVATGTGSASGGTSSGGGGGSAAFAKACLPNGAGSAATTVSGVSVSIGSKSFAEEQILAEIAKAALTKHGFNVTYTTQEADPQIGQDLQAGKIDMLWQYTGTEAQKYLNEDMPPTDLDAAFADVQDKDAAKGLCWVGKAPMNDTNGLAIRSGDVGKFGSTLTAFTAYIKAHSDTKVCVMQEFLSRNDGVPGLQATYGDVWGGYNYIQLQKTAEGDIAKNSCDAGEVFTTDSGIAANNLTVLADDKKLFPPDNVGLIVQAKVLTAHPEIAAIINPIAAKITSTEITKLNKLVEIDNMKAADVAAAWLQQNGF